VRAPQDLGIEPSIPEKALNLLTGGSRGAEPWGTPFGVALGDSGDWCFTDTARGEVVCVDRARRDLWRWGHVGTNILQTPVGIACAGDRVYVADSSLCRVLIADRRGHPQGELPGPFQRPVAVAARGERVYVVDAGTPRVHVFSAAGERLFMFGSGGNGNGEFNHPTHIAVDAQGRILVADSLNSRVQRFDANGRFERIIGGRGDSSGHFSRPKGVAVDADDNVYVVDGMFGIVQIFDERGRLLLELGGPGQEDGQFWLPAGIAVDADGRVVVADAYNHRLQWFQLLPATSGVDTLAAQTGTNGGSR
jgi:DNA-binding beta-propeller fold protein YncE